LELPTSRITKTPAEDFYFDTLRFLIFFIFWRFWNRFTCTQHRERGRTMLAIHHQIHEGRKTYSIAHTTNKTTPLTVAQSMG
jgi:hypothetical protein